MVLLLLQTSDDVSEVNGFDCDCKRSILHFPSSTAPSVILYFPMNSLQFKRENICQRKLFFYFRRYILFRSDLNQCWSIGPSSQPKFQTLLDWDLGLSIKDYSNIVISKDTAGREKWHVLLQVEYQLGNNSLQSFAEF